MSATIDASSFLEYFGEKNTGPGSILNESEGARFSRNPLTVDFIDLPGKTNYPIEEFFAEDLFLRGVVDQNFHIKGARGPGEKKKLWRGPGGGGGHWNNQQSSSTTGGAAGKDWRNPDVTENDVWTFLDSHAKEQVKSGVLVKQNGGREGDVSKSMVMNISNLLHRPLAMDTDFIAQVVQYIEREEMRAAYKNDPHQRNNYRDNTKHDRHPSTAASSSSSTPSAGAILIFVPGWMEITDTMKALKKLKSSTPDFSKNGIEWRFLPLHSMVPPNEQNLVFKKVERHVRKIIISTNIAETSVTIEDVVYVIDTGLNKGTTYTPETNIAALETLQCARSNVQQRRGRAGRSRPGQFFKLFSKYEWENCMADHEVPEMLRTPVEELCLQVKALQLPGLLSIQETLSKAIVPPERLAVQNAVALLQALGALVVNDRSSFNRGRGAANPVEQVDRQQEEPESLTPLGWKLSMIPCHPCLGKMLLLGSLLSGSSASTNPMNQSSNTNSSSSSSARRGVGLLEQDTSSNIHPDLLSICATLSFKTPFVLPFGKEKEADAAKLNFGFGLWSDHLLFAKVYFEFANKFHCQPHGGGFYDWCDRNFLSSKTLEMTETCRKDLLGYLKDLHLDDGSSVARQGKMDYNAALTPRKKALLHCVLAASLNLAVQLPSEQVFKGLTDKVSCQPHPSSLIKNIGAGKKPKRTARGANNSDGAKLHLAAYFERMKTSEVYLRDNTLIQDVLPLVLFLPEVTQRQEVAPAAIEDDVDKDNYSSSTSCVFEVKGTDLLISVPRPDNDSDVVLAVDTGRAGRGHQHGMNKTNGGRSAQSWHKNNNEKASSWGQNFYDDWGGLEDDHMDWDDDAGSWKDFYEEDHDRSWNKQVQDDQSGPRGSSPATSSEEQIANLLASIRQKLNTLIDRTIGVSAQHLPAEVGAAFHVLQQVLEASYSEANEQDVECSACDKVETFVLLEQADEQEEGL
ncbi:unnamed protein product [Amoebophrya sp. A120]|nr:unnamed protein product [Amoebophrya sp. A120]|eukprot:GSA120T00011074001.1